MEQIKDKLRKIKVLADQGVDGEAINAKNQLEKLLLKYDLKVDDLFDNTLKWRKFKVKNSERKLFRQTVASVIGNRYLETYYRQSSPSIRELELTDEEFIDIDQKFNFYKSLYQKEVDKMMKNLFTAFINKHSIFNCESNHSDEKIEFDLEEYLRLIRMMNDLEDKTFLKQLTK